MTARRRRVVPSAGHHFGENLKCRCGWHWERHQGNPIPCPQPDLTRPQPEEMAKRYRVQEKERRAAKRKQRADARGALEQLPTPRLRRILQATKRPQTRKRVVAELERRGEVAA